MSLFIDNATVEGLLQHKSWNINVNAVTVAAVTQTLTSTSEATQVYSGSTSGQIVKMPDATTFGQTGQRYWLHNDSTQNVTIQDNAAGSLFLLGPNQRALLVCTGTGSAAGTWSYILLDKTTSGSTQFTVTYPGTGLAVNYTGGTARFNGTSTIVAGGTITLTASVSNGWIYVDIDGVVKQSASLPVNVMPLYQFTTSGSAVTVLTDEREVVDQNLVWGVVGDIVTQTAGQAKAAGTLEKYARADHVHGNGELLVKSGTVSSGTFSGTPKTAAVTFGTAFASTAYSIKITGSDARIWSWSSKATTGFTISSNANQALTANVDWEATFNGEST